MIETAYYNEHDPFAYRWLENLIKKRLIADGDVDGRSIEDVTPTDVKAYRQCHFFAGIGVWSHSLIKARYRPRTANERVWTMSCPCQPFSPAGKGAGFDDERHLWPAAFWLVQQCQPELVFGEQVAHGGGAPWLDLVQSDLEGIDYTTGAVNVPACGFGAPHIRQRAYWVAYSNNKRPQGRIVLSERADQRTTGPRGVEDRLAHANHPHWRSDEPREADHNRNDPRRQKAHSESGACREVRRRIPSHSFWRDADWLKCTDGKWRSVEPGTFPLAHGASQRVGRLRGYGNAIVGPVAVEFIKAALDCMP